MSIQLFRILDRITPGIARSLSWEMCLTAITFPASILMNRALGAEDRGLLAIIILIPTTLFTIGSCQWDRLLQSNITSKQFSSFEAWRVTLHYALWLSFIFLPIGFGLSLIYGKLGMESRWLSAIYSLNFPLTFLCGCLASIYLASGNIDGQYWMRIGLQGSYCALLVFLVLTNLISVPAMIAIYIAMHVVCLLVGWSFKNRLLEGKISKQKPSPSPLVKAFFPYALESFSGRIDIWAFSWFSPLASLGQYSGITTMMLPVGLVSNALTSASTARLDWTHTALVNRYLLKTLIVLACLLVLLSTGGFFLGPYILETLLGKTFSSGYWMIPWIAVLVATQAASVQFHTALRLAGNVNAYLKVQAIEPLIKLLLVFLLGWQFSELGIMLGIIISSCLKLSVCFYFNNFSHTNKN